MFGIGKRTVFKVLKDRPRDFIDLSSLADCDIDQSVYVARKLVARLYDQKEKLKAGHVDLNKLRVRLEFGTALTTILPILFHYCYKYCYGDSRNL
jgi:hypothetical protein